jgi:VanZ family protein
MRILSLAARIIAYVFTTLILVLSTVPPTLRPETSIPHRLEHASIFAATGLAFALGYPRNRALLAALLVIFSGSVELVQLLIPGRHARISDFLVDALSACLGLLIGSALLARV